MIDEYWTFRFFGYMSDSLSYGSSKKVVAVCEECGVYRAIIFNHYRDLCPRCSNRTRKNLGFIGRKHSEESKRNMSITRSGRSTSDETKRKLSISHRRENLSEETILKMRIAGKKKKFGEETRRKMSVAASKKRGGLAPNWRGGASFEPYCSKFNERFKESIREQFDRTCFFCSTTEHNDGRKLSVHHVNYHKNCLCDDVECEFVPLCRRCHAKTNANRDFWERLIIYALQYHEEERIIECIDILEMVTSNGKTCSWTALSCTILKRAGLNRKLLTV